MITPIDTDYQLRQQVINGDRKAYELLFERFYPELCAYACQWVALEDAENVVWDSRAGLISGIVNGESEPRVLMYDGNSFGEIPIDGIGY